MLYGRKDAAHRLSIAESTVDNTLATMRDGARASTNEQLIYIGAAEGWLVIAELARGRSHARRTSGISQVAPAG